MMKLRAWTLLLTVAALALQSAGCSLFREKELDGKEVKRDETEISAQNCDVIPPNGFDEHNAGVVLPRSLDCLQKIVDEAFNSVRGQTENEISVREVEALHRRGVVDLGIEESDQWRALEGVISLLDPAGRPVIQKKRIDGLIQILREYAGLYARNAEKLLNSPSEVPDSERLLLVQLTDRFAAFFDGQGKVSSEQIQEIISYLAKKATEAAAEKNETPLFSWPMGREREWAAAVFTLKDLLISNDSGRAVLEAKGLARLFRLASRVAAEMSLSAEWLKNSGNPLVMPGAEMRGEWERVGKIVQSYFNDHRFQTLSADQFRWAAATLMPDSGIGDSLNDVVRLTQRLTPAEKRKNGIHAIGIAPLFDVLPLIYDDLKDATRAFGHCPLPEQLRERKRENDRLLKERRYDEMFAMGCEITLRDALRGPSPQLRSVALKGNLNWPDMRQVSRDGSNNTDSPVRRLDATFNWDSVTERMIQRRIIGRVFNAFDRDGDGRILIPARPDDEKREILDLSFALLRLISSQEEGRDPSDPFGGQLEARTRSHVPVKPAALASVVGLIGDRWSSDGDQDGQLNADEFFTIVSTYMAIQSAADQVASSLKSDLKTLRTPHQNDPRWFISETDWRYFPDPITRALFDADWSTDWVYRRSRLIGALSERGYEYSLPAIQDDLRAIPPEQRLSLFHALIGSPEQPASLYRSNAVFNFNIDTSGPTSSTLVGTLSEGPVLLRQYSKVGDVLAPTALLVLLDRMMMLCDRDEDGALSWSELSCATPLVVGAGRGVVTSELVNLDPGVHDGSQILLQFLSQPGFPQRLAKVLLMNGSVREQRLTMAELASATEGAKIGWPQIAKLIGMPEGATPAQANLWATEARSRYQRCDANANDRIDGEGEQKCLTDSLLKQTLELLKQLVRQEGISESVAHGLLDQFVQVDLIRIAFIFATLDDSEMDRIFERNPNLRSSTAKILQVLEDAIRRSKKICLDQDC